MKVEINFGLNPGRQYWLGWSKKRETTLLATVKPHPQRGVKIICKTSEKLCIRRVAKIIRKTGHNKLYVMRVVKIIHKAGYNNFIRNAGGENYT